MLVQSFPISQRIFDFVKRMTVPVCNRRCCYWILISFRRRILVVVVSVQSLIVDRVVYAAVYASSPASEVETSVLTSVKEAAVGVNPGVVVVVVAAVVVFSSFSLVDVVLNARSYSVTRIGRNFDADVVVVVVVIGIVLAPGWIMPE